jgi:hypothetical protein
VCDPFGGGSDSQNSTSQTSSNSNAVTVNSTNNTSVTVDTKPVADALNAIAGLNDKQLAVLAQGQAASTAVLKQLGAVVGATVAQASATTQQQADALKVQTRIEIAIALVGLVSALIAAHVFGQHHRKGKK